MSFDDQELIDDFIDESRSSLEDIEQQFLAIEQGGENIDHDLVNTIFRAIHSMKGAASFLGFTTIQNLAHVLESVLDHVRNDNLVPNSETVDVMLEAADTLRGLLDDAMTSNDADVSAHVSALQAILDTVKNGESQTKAETGKKETSTETPYEAKKVGQPAAQPARQSDAAAPVSPVEKSHSAPTSKSASPCPSAHPKVETNLRVPISVVDKLMNLVGELVLSRNQLLQSISIEQLAAIKAVGPRINQVTTELQEAVMQTRLQPVGNVFNKFTRVVRDLNKKLNKKCKLVLDGADVEIDKSIIEALGDPMTHLVRNSLDHAIELPIDRADKGKPEEGTLLLSAAQDAGSVKIIIKDDGAGINAEKVKQKAIEKGILSADRAASMTEREAARLIFEPGFSTAAVVSDVSGRGVGMDVVRTNIEKLGGIVDVDTQMNVGTTITITLPLTLAIMPALIVRNGEQFVAIPQINIGELVRLRREEIPKRIGCIKGAKLLRSRGSLLPLIKLSDVLQTEDSIDLNAEDLENLPREFDIVILEMGGSRFGLLAEELLQSEEIVVKSIGRHFADCECLAGATILGSGDVALILDIKGIAPDAQLQDSEKHTQCCGSVGSGDDACTTTVLLFRNHPEEQFAIPMGLIVRIEEADFACIETVAGQKVLQRDRTSMPLISLENQICAEPAPELDSVHIAVFDVMGREVGLIIPQVLDLCEVDLESDTALHRECGVMGSIVVNEKPTRVINLGDLAEKSLPDWYGEQLYPSSRTLRPATLLLVEDSTFFRRQLVDFFQAKGYQVLEAEDGESGWQQIQRNPSIDLVITDIEMPRLDGFGLCSRIRQHTEFKNLPIIALSSLSSEDDRQRALSCGVDNFQTKMNQRELHRAVAHLLQSASTLTEHEMATV